MDYRYDDPPTRPYVPWRAGLASYEMQRLPPLVAYPSRTKRRRLDVCYRILLQVHASADGVFVQSLLRALRRACGLSMGTRSGRAVA